MEGAMLSIHIMPYHYEMMDGIKKFKFKNLKEFHLTGVDHYGDEEFLETITENFPKLQRLCLTLQYVVWKPGWNDIFQKFASEKSIEIEISSVLTCVCGHAAVCTPKTHWKCKYFYPK